MTKQNTEPHGVPDDWWTSGFCSTFAAGLKKMFGGELWAIANHSRKWGDDQLWHCYCVVDGVAYDADGPHSVAEASDTSEERYPIPEMDKEHDVVMVWKKVSEQWLDKVHQDYNPGDFPLVFDFVRRHPERFRDLAPSLRL